MPSMQVKELAAERRTECSRGRKPAVVGAKYAWKPQSGGGNRREFSVAAPRLIGNLLTFFRGLAPTATFQEPLRGRLSAGLRENGNRPTPSAHVFSRTQIWLFAACYCSFSATLAIAAEPARANLEETQRLFRHGEYAACIEAAAKAAGEANEEWPLLKIKAEMTLGRYADARKTLEAALARHSGSVRLRWIGRDVYRFNRLPEAAGSIIEELGQRVRQSPWLYRDAANEVTVGRFLLAQGMDAKQVLRKCFDEAKQQQPDFVEAWLAGGDLALEKGDFALAAEQYDRAAKLAGDNADAQLGLARAYAPSEPKLAEKAIAAALHINPNHVDSLLYIVDEHIDAERYADARQLLERIRSINAEHPLHWAYRAVLAHFDNEAAKETEARQAALRWWSTNPQVDHLIGTKLSQKYRFAEGAAYQRRALALDAAYLPAKIQLSQDLLRLGDEEDGWPLAKQVYDEDGYNVLAHNLVTLHDDLDKFRSLERDGFIVRMDSREADVYGDRVLDLLSRAKKQLCEKYEVSLDEPVIVELFPRQEDFAIRTFGMPGGVGFLGVCFGRVITANSPASQAGHPANWEATLWHEFCHVVTLHKTNNKMPRWLSEGISVYEERQADSTWGQAINPRYREMLLGDDLTPVSQISGAFLHPPTPLHLQFAYYESSLVVEYLAEKYGLPVLKRLLVDLGVGMPINDALARYTGSLEALDREFAEFAIKRANQFAPQADWSDPNLPANTSATDLAGWWTEHPNNYRALQQLATQLISEREWQKAQEPLKKMIELYPENGGADSPYLLMATTQRELANTVSERAALEKLAALTADNIDALSRLTQLAFEAEDWRAVRKYGDRLLAIQPLRPAPYRWLATAAQRTDDTQGALSAWRTLLVLDPIDPAEAHYQLATLLRKAGDLPAAKRQALQALEEAPRYRAAQRELLAIIRQVVEQKKEESPATTPLTK